MKTWQVEHKKKLIEPEFLESFALKRRAEGKTLATINGSYDILHPGHLQSLFEASQLADILIVGLNSDSSIQKYKSPRRPIMTLKHRLQMIAALSWVDYVSWFEETDPLKFLKKIKPNVHVNGIQWKENCVEEEFIKSYGGDVHYVSLIPELSTTRIVNRIVNRG